MNRRKRSFFGGWLASCFSMLFFLAACGSTPPGPGPNPDPNVKPGQTSFSSEGGENGNGSYTGTRGSAENDAGSAAPNAAPGGGSADSKAGAGTQNAPSGREGTVEEADLYRVNGNNLFYLNTYKGLTIFDLSDRKKPKKLSNLPVFGYPIEMFVEKNIAYALVRDALYLVRVNGKFEFRRHHVSQLVSIDISRPTRPRVLQRLDIKGQLREGVSRKIEDTIYVVSYKPRWYWWGWSYNRKETDEQATVYSFNVSNPRSIREVQHIDLIKDRPKSTNNSGTSSGGARTPSNKGENYSFSGVTISATANTLLVGENWHYHRYDYSKSCGDYENYNFTKMNIVDISDPKGNIKIHTRFKVRGRLGDQFKQTYLFDKKTNKGTYYGVFARREWNRNGCDRGEQLIKNTFISVDITNGSKPVTLDELEFGKPNETVRGSYFDRERKVLYAITAIQRDPFYAISFSNPSNLTVLSEIDGLSGDINLFRPLLGGDYLLAVGRDNSNTCTGFGEDEQRWSSTKLAVSIIDVRNLNKARLVQRKCIRIKNAGWMSSEINWNLDQAHKMIGLQHAGKVSLLTLPVSYYTRNNERGWWWSSYKSAIGVMQIDLAKYDDTKSEKDQTVLENIATIQHPKGSVRRTIITDLSGKRSVINLSDTHLSLVDLQDLRNPGLLSTFELAPYIRTVYRFGNYIVEQVNLGRNYSDFNEFRVKQLGAADLNDAPAIASFKIGQIQNVIRWGNLLVFFRRALKEVKTSSNGHKYPVYDYNRSEMVIYDLSNPRTPKQRGKATLPINFAPYYYFYCGMFDMAWDFGRYYYGNQTSWINTLEGIAVVSGQYNRTSRKYERKLSFLSFRNPDSPSFKSQTLSTDRNYMNLVRMDGRHFYLANNKLYKKVQDGNRTRHIYRDYAQSWTLTSKGWKGGEQINLPGRLMRAFEKDGDVQFLTTDRQYIVRKITREDGRSYTQYQQVFRLFLLEQVDSKTASLLDFKTFMSWNLRNTLLDGNRLYLNASRDWYWLQKKKLGWEDRSDQLMIFDLSKDSFKQTFSAPTRTTGTQLVGIRGAKLFIKLPGEGILVADVRDASQPKGLHFERTLGWVTNIEFAGDLALVAAGHFGIYQLNMKTVTIPQEM